MPKGGGLNAAAFFLLMLQPHPALRESDFDYGFGGGDSYDWMDQWNASTGGDSDSIVKLDPFEVTDNRVDNWFAGEGDANFDVDSDDFWSSLFGGNDPRDVEPEIVDHDFPVSPEPSTPKAGTAAKVTNAVGNVLNAVGNAAKALLGGTNPDGSKSPGLLTPFTGSSKAEVKRENLPNGQQRVTFADGSVETRGGGLVDPKTLMLGVALIAGAVVARRYLK